MIQSCLSRIQEHTFSILLFVFLCFTPSLAGQANYRPGHIVTFSGDTVRGLISERGEAWAKKVCIFKSDRDSKRRKLGPDSIQAYHIEQGPFFVSKPMKARDSIRPVFLRVLIRGDYSLYYDRSDKLLRYYLEDINGDWTGLLNLSLNYHSIKDIGYYGLYQSIRINEAFYRDTLKEIFPQKELAPIITDIDYSSKSLMELLRVHATWYCPDRECISYDWDLFRPRVHFGVLVGYQWMKSYSDPEAWTSMVETAVPVGLSMDIPMPYIHDRFTFHTELLYRRIDYYQLENIDGSVSNTRIQDNEISIPYGFQYRYLPGRVSPVLGFGREIGLYFRNEDNYPAYVKGIYDSHRGSWYAELGGEMKLGNVGSAYVLVRIQRQMNRIGTGDKDYSFDTAPTTLFKTHFIALHTGFRF